MNPLLPPPAASAGGLSAPATVATAAPLPAALQPGMVLQATVVAQTAAGGAVLQFGSTRLEVRSAVPLAVGEQLSLEVTHASRLVVMARRDTPTSPPAPPAPPSAQQALSSLLIPLVRDRLPRQQYLRDLLGELRRRAVGGAQAGSDAARGAAAFLRELPRRPALTDPDRLAAWLRQSQPLVGGSASLDARLGELLAALGAGALREQVAGVQARRELLALPTMVPRRGERAVLTVELPVAADAGRPDEVISVRIARQRLDSDGTLAATAAYDDGTLADDLDDDPSARPDGGEDDATPRHRWRAELAFSLPEVGDLRATVLVCGHTGAVSTLFESADSGCRGRIEAALERLKRRLLAHGLSVAELEVGTGPAADGAAAHPLAPVGLRLDEAARELLQRSLVHEQV